MGAVAESSGGARRATRRPVLSAQAVPLVARPASAHAARAGGGAAAGLFPARLHKAPATLPTVRHAAPTLHGPGKQPGCAVRRSPLLRAPVQRGERGVL